MKYDIIIIGAGAAGLMAAHDLLKAGYRVCLLEAGAMAGGRIATLHDKSFTMPVETGAEFVHGKLPLTLDLLDAAGISYLPVEGNMIAVQNGKWLKHQAHDKHWNSFIRALKKLKTDLTIEQFLQQNFAGEEYTALKDAVKHYSEGFDLADIRNASALAAQREWAKQEETQFRIPGGYSQLTDHLLRTCEQLGVSVYFDTCVTTVRYDKQGVTAYSSNDRAFSASKAIITVSAGLMQSGALVFDPLPGDNFLPAFQELGFGDVIKVLLQFKNDFWTERSADIGFILSDEPIPTWWTQLPVKDNLLTGWLGGPEATIRSQQAANDLFALSLQSLASIFDTSAERLQQQVLNHRIFCWRQHPYVKGGYSYVKQGSVDTKKILSHPVDGMLFFAGEALFRGESQGTVEAALQSGRETAAKIKTYPQ
jgi:monoamine oxidase